jgi:hypothetical protein
MDTAVSRKQQWRFKRAIIPIAPLSLQQVRQWWSYGAGNRWLDNRALTSLWIH